MTQENSDSWVHEAGNKLGYGSIHEFLFVIIYSHMLSGKLEVKLLFFCLDKLRTCNDQICEGCHNSRIDFHVPI